MPGNNAGCVKKCFEHRSNWRECNSQVNTLFNFKWKETINTIDFNNLSKVSFKQMVNHFEFHATISNKLQLFINIMNYCEKTGLDVLKYLPFSILFQYESPGYLTQFDNFSHVFHNINDWSLFEIVA